MTAGLLFMGLPLFVWAWRAAIVNLAADCIAEGIRRSRT